MKTYYVMCSNFYGTYTAGQFVANSATEAIEMAKDNYRRKTGANDANAFRWWTTNQKIYSDM